MKLTKLTTLFSLAVVCVGLGMASASRAAYTTYLEGLQAEVTTRLETSEDPAQTKALNAANKALARNSKSLSQDLGIFSSAITTLNKAFPDDSALDAVETSAFNQFLGEAESQYNTVNSGSALHTNGVPPSLSNALSKAYNALTNAQNNTNWAARIRALNLAFVKIKAAQTQLNKSLKAPGSLEEKSVNVDLHGEGHEHFTLASDGSYQREGGETGTWSYNRTSANTGTITLNIEGGGSHVLNVTFKSPKSGTFTVEGEEGVTGKISVK